MVSIRRASSVPEVQFQQSRGKETFNHGHPVQPVVTMEMDQLKTD